MFTLENICCKTMISKKYSSEDLNLILTEIDNNLYLYLIFDKINLQLKLEYSFENFLKFNQNTELFYNDNYVLLKFNDQKFLLHSENNTEET